MPISSACANAAPSMKKGEAIEGLSSNYRADWRGDFAAGRLAKLRVAAVTTSPSTRPGGSSA
jgi:hypothetical protein